MSCKYVYRKLNQSRKETRVVVILPGFSHEPVHCFMRTISLLEDPIPNYETISYVWGVSTVRGVVSVDNFTIDVPSSAEAVLKRMRDPERERTVWIDSICIDQNDVQDRNYQVQLMCDIYSKTSCGLIWLGEDKNCAVRVFESLNALYDEARRDTNEFKNFKEIVWPGWFDAYGHPSAVLYDAELLASFFDLPWFARLWVVQEAALAPKSICHYGQHTLPLTILQRSAIWLYNKSKTIRSDLSGHSGLARAVHLASYTDELFATPFRTENNLLWMLNTLKQYDTSREEDHVYGLVGMYQRFLQHKQILSHRLVPDYGKSLKYVLCNAAKLAIEELQQLDTLLYVCHRTNAELEQANLPTWVPKWHRKQNLELDPFPLNFKGFDAAGSSRLCIEADDENLEKLTVHGFIVGEISEVSEAFSHDTLLNSRDLLTLLLSTEHLVAKAGKSSTDWHGTLVASLDHQMKRVTTRHNKEGYNALIHRLHLDESGSTKGENRHNAKITMANLFHEALMRWMRNRRFFVTQTGEIGTAPQIVQPEDIITILRGSRMPIVLRKRDQGEHYAVVGQAYLMDHMFGEAVRCPKRRGLVDETFTLI